MRILVPLLLLLALTSSVFAQETEKTDIVIEKMSYKLARGVANMATCVVELPKQVYLTSRDKGAATGFIIGPLKGVGMTLYRAIAGISETIFFMVPQPGYYNAMIDPDFVWKGWEETHLDWVKANEAEPAEGQPEKKGE